MTFLGKTRVATGAFLLLTSGICLFAIPAAPAAAQRVGGYAPADPGGAEVQAAGRFAAMQLGQGRRVRLASVDRAERQVVAGMNFRLDITLTNHSRWQVVVFRALNGRMTLRSRMRLLGDGG